MEKDEALFMNKSGYITSYSKTGTQIIQWPAGETKIEGTHEH